MELFRFAAFYLKKTLRKHASAWQFLVVSALAILGCGTLRAQSVDYVYGIENSSPGWVLDQLTINYGADTYTQQALVSLSSLIPGFNTTTQLNGSVNGLALDATTHTLFFTYSNNNNASSTAGTFTATTYAIQSTGPTTWSINQLYTMSVASGAADAPGGTNTAAKPAAINAGSGWLSKAAYYNGAYYAGVQGGGFVVQDHAGQWRYQPLHQPVDLFKHQPRRGHRHLRRGHRF